MKTFNHLKTQVISFVKNFCFNIKGRQFVRLSQNEIRNYIDSTKDALSREKEINEMSEEVISMFRDLGEDIPNGIGKSISFLQSEFAVLKKELNTLQGAYGKCSDSCSVIFIHNIPYLLETVQKEMNINLALLCCIYKNREELIKSHAEIDSMSEEDISRVSKKLAMEYTAMLNQI